MSQVPYDWNNPAGPKPSGASAIFNSVVQTIATALQIPFTTARMAVLAAGIVVVTATVGAIAFNLLQPGPDAAAKAWVQALADQDGSQLSELTCAQLRPQLQQSLLVPSAVMILGQGFLGTQAKMDMNDLKSTTVSNDGTHAKVRMVGTIHNGVGLFSQTQQVDASQNMLKENGKWRMCV
jgi:hypothetical protein